MARSVFGGSASNAVWNTTSAGGWNLAALVFGQVVTMWSAQTGGMQYTDLLSAGGGAITSVTTGSNGILPTFSGPDGITSMWADAGSTRVRLDPNQPDAISTAAWAKSPRVVDLTYPVLIAHRGGANLGAENSLDAYKNSITLGYVAVEAGDVQALADGTLVIMHDATVDRTTTGTGAVNTFTRATWSALQDKAAAQWGGSYVNVPAPFWDDALAALGGRCVIVPEVKDQLDSTATAMCNRLDALGLRDSTILQSFNVTNCAIAAARGYKTMFLGGTFAGMVGPLAGAQAAGVWALGFDYTAADFNAAQVAQYQAMGFRVFVYTLDHQASYATAIANGVDGIFTNEGTFYVAGKTANYRATSTSWHKTGRWEQGDLSNGDGPMTPAGRGTLIGPTGNWRFKSGGSRGMIPGNLCPLANAAATYTLNVNVVVDTIPGTTTDGPAIYVAMPDDSVAGATDMWNCYMVKARANGGVQMWEISNVGGVTSLGTSTCTAFQNLTLTAAITASGVFLTTITVSAITVALKVGHQFVLPTGQVVTINAAAIIGATSLTVVSFLPKDTTAIGGVLKPYITITANVTPTTVNASRGDETSVAAISAANTAHRGGYFGLSGSSFASGACSYHKVIVT